MQMNQARSMSSTKRDIDCFALTPLIAITDNILHSTGLNQLKVPFHSSGEGTSKTTPKTEKGQVAITLNDFHCVYPPDENSHHIEAWSSLELNKDLEKISKCTPADMYFKEDLRPHNFANGSEDFTPKRLRLSMEDGQERKKPLVRADTK
ncbi:hypothetical protein DdX_17701 [Ditylenchus destructor]|uniref:Uncharacterized protein n=1 Tax=Ditylenchus destructor TaxID=166010 RepID=A0AAD4MMY7_9BILA|nr:hypothetical protein DdX_17701 [Ditylenchus destructor]